eukprot:12510679-Alexandrium_andersonii.AAC.1
MRRVLTPPPGRRCAKAARRQGAVGQFNDEPTEPAARTACRHDPSSRPLLTHGPPASPSDGSTSIPHRNLAWQ